MKLNKEQLQYLSGLAERAAYAAGNIINQYSQGKIEVLHKDRGDSLASQVVTEVDHKAQKAILKILEPVSAEYDLAILTEESPDNGERLEKQAFWSIDPMDGTLAFIQKTPGYSVSIALVAKNGDPMIGVVYDPVNDSLIHSIRGDGIFRNRIPLTIPSLDLELPLVLKTDPSFKKHPWFDETLEGLEVIAGELGLKGAEVQYAAGGVMTACKILQAPNICYFKYSRTGNSGGSLWDYAATACLFHEAGAIATDIYGNSMELNRPDSTFMNHHGLLYAANKDLADRIIALNASLEQKFL